MLNNSCNTCPANETVYDGIAINYEINDGEFKFDIQEIEIYQVHSIKS